MGVEKKNAGKKWLWLIALVAVIAVAAGACGIMMLSGSEPAPTEPTGESVIEGNEDDWLREALAEDSVRTIELNEDIKAVEGYEVNGEKTLVGTGKISMTEGSNFVLSVNEGASLTVDGVTLNVKNIGNNGVVVRAGGKLEWTSGTISYPKQYAIINYGETTISGGVFEYAGANWLYLKSGTTADITGGYFVKSGSAGFEVEEGATLNISGEDTLMERAGTNTINNNGTVVMTGGTIAQSEVWTITNHGKLTMANVTVKDCALKGVLYNYADCESAEISNCTFTNSKTYHVYNQKEVTIKDTTMDKSGGSSLNNQPDAVMNVENVSLTNCGYHGIYNDRGTINIKNCSIDTTVYKGVQNKTGYVTIDGLILNNVGGAGLGNVAVVAGAGYGYIHANNVTATNTVGYNVVSYGGEVILSNSTFNKTPGANVYIRNGTATIDNCKILGTTTAGKVALALGSDTYRTVVTTIKGNTEITGSASRGVTNYGTLHIYGGSIHGNATSGTKKAGGGLYTLGTVYMYGGSITGNRATTYGGGVRVDDDDRTAGQLYMYGGYIGNNYAGANGGGISVADSRCGLYLYGGTVANNKAAKKGDGLLINGTFELYQDAVIQNNDVYLWNETRFIDVKTPGLSGDALTVRHGALSEGVLIAKFSSEHDASEMSSHFVGANNQYDFVTDADKLIATVAYNDLVSPADFTNAQTVTVTTFQQLKKAVESTSGEKVITIAADIPMTGIINVPASASVKLIDDGTARTLTRSGYAGELFWLDREANLYLTGSAGLTLDGDSLNGTTAKKPLVFITTEGYLVLQEGATLQNNTNTSYETSSCAGAVNLYGGRMIMEGGVITGCNAPTYETESSGMTNRSAIYVSTSGVLSIKGGEIKDNMNGAIRSYGRVYLSGGAISGNHRYGDGGAAIRAPWIYMTGGTISGNKSTNAGGAIYLTPSEAIPNGYFYMNGGQITGNYSGVNDSDPNYNFNTTGGAIYIESGCTFECPAGVISGNQSIGDADGKNGGAIYNAGTVILGSGAVLSDNHATRNAGAIFNKNAAAVLTVHGAQITGNTTDGRGGAIFSEGGNNVVTITGATFENNKGLGGGAIVFSNGTNTVTNTVFKGNVGERLAESYGNGGAILNMSKSGLTLTGCTFENNQAIAKDGGGGEGGAIYNGGGSIELTDCTFSGNAARVGFDILNSSDSLGLVLNGTVKFDGGIYIAKNHPVTLGETFVNGGETPIATALASKDLGVQVFSGAMTEEKIAMFDLDLADGTYIDLTNGLIWADGAQLTVVAKNGKEEYYSLAAAVLEAEAGDTITIVADIVLNSSVTIDKSITLTTDGQRDYTITGTPSSSNYYINIKAENVVVGGTGETSRLIIDGLGVSNPRALVAIQGANGKLQYMVLQNNVNSSDTEGGAIYTNKTGVEINNCLIQNNKSCGGGAIYVTSAGEVTFNNCQLLNNESTKYGGAIQGASSSSGIAAVVTLNNCVVEGNTAANVGGAAYMSQSSSKYPATLIANNTAFTNNTTPKNGGVLRVTGAFQFTGCTFTGNSGADGDISEGNSTAFTRTLTDCVFDKTEEAALAKNASTKIVITNCTFAKEMVAAIGETEYETLTAALAAAQDGDTIVLKKDVTEDINVDGKTVTVTGGTITGNAAVTGTLNLTDATISGNAAVEGTLGLTGSAAVVSGKVTLGENGVIAVAGTLTADTAATVAPVTVGKTVLTGDVVANVSHFALDTTDPKYILGEDGKIAELTFVAQVGGVGYTTLTEAVAAAEDGASVTLLTDLSIDGITFTKNVTLTSDAAVALTGTATLESGVTVTMGDHVSGGVFILKDATAAVTGANYASHAAYTAKNGTTYAIAMPEGTVTVNDSTLTAYTSLNDAVAAASEGDTIVIVNDVVLSETVTVETKLTITTDGKRSYTVTGTPSSGNYYINVKATSVICGTGETSRLIIDGENATHDRPLVCLQAANCELRYVTLQNNVSTYTGGAVYTNKTGGVLSNCILQSCSSTGGGAVYLTGAGGMTLNDCQILKNSSSKYGGAFQGASGSTLTLNGCTVDGNISTDVGGAGYFAQSSGKPATIIATNTEFTNNSTAKNGGVIRATGAFQLTGCTFTGNSGADADISEGNGTAYTRTITGCTFDKTEAAAIAKHASTKIVITDCTFVVTE